MNENLTLMDTHEDDNLSVKVYKEEEKKTYDDGEVMWDPDVPRYPWNVITEKEFKKRINTIFEMVANALKNTLGPYGSSTLIENLGTYHLTKDGFTVLKNIHFNDRTNNTILNTILTISHQMVMKVGDGSTSSIIAAYNFLRRLEECKELKELRPRDLKIVINEFVDMATQYIQSNATEVNDKNFVNTVEHIARVATNDDTTYTDMITDIYRQCGKDVTISKSKSETNEAYVTIKEDMFYIDGTYLDKIYCNSDGGSKSTLNKAGVVFFNFTLEDKHWSLVTALMNSFAKMDVEAQRQLVIIAPYYDNYFLDRVKNDINKFRAFWNQQANQAGAIPFPMVFGKAPFFKDIQKDIYDDATAFLGCNMINPVDANHLLDEIGKLQSEQIKMEEYKRFHLGYENEEEANAKWLERHGEIPSDPTESIDAFYTELEERIGTCDTTVLSDKTIEFTGLTNIDIDMVHIRTQIANAQMKKELDEVENLRYVSKDYIAAKERLSRLSLKSANIAIGGNSELEKKMNDDAVDDAIKACNSAIRYGINPGCNVAIIQACLPELNRSLATASPMVKKVAEVCLESFLDVIETIFNNKYGKESKSRESVRYIAETSAVNNQCYDLVTEQFSNTIINSCRTDIEILRGAIAIIGVILSSNQYLAIDIK